MSHFHTNVVTPVSFPTTPQVDLGFEPDIWVLRNDHATAVDFSFDGINVHGTIPGIVGTVVEVRSRAKKLWAQNGAGSGDLDIRANNGASPS